MLTAAVSGSFHRHMAGISAAVQELRERSVRVLSPADPRIVAHKDEFLFVASDRLRSVRLVQDRHLDCIRAADLLWLVCPDGYVGTSASMEIGAAVSAGVPIFATHAPSDITLREYVKVVPSLDEALSIVAASPRPKRPESILIDPHASIEEAHRTLDQLDEVLRQNNGDPALQVYEDVNKLQTKLRLPAIVQ